MSDNFVDGEKKKEKPKPPPEILGVGAAADAARKIQEAKERRRRLLEQI